MPGIRIVGLSCLAAVLSLFPPNAGADEPVWKVGLASVKITPEEPVRMSGYSGRTEPSQGVALDLYAKSSLFRMTKAIVRCLSPAT